VERGAYLRALSASRQALASANGRLEVVASLAEAVRALFRTGPAVPSVVLSGVSASSWAGSGPARPTAAVTEAFIASRSAWAAVVSLPAALAAAIRAARLVLTVANLV
jgi:hypothetical protein